MIIAAKVGEGRAVVEVGTESPITEQMVLNPDAIATGNVTPAHWATVRSTVTSGLRTFRPYTVGVTEDASNVLDFGVSVQGGATAAIPVGAEIWASVQVSVSKAVKLANGTTTYVGLPLTIALTSTGAGAVDGKSVKTRGDTAWSTVEVSARIGADRNPKLTITADTRNIPGAAQGGGNMNLIRPIISTRRTEYFSGATPGAKWTGTADASSSTRPRGGLDTMTLVRVVDGVSTPVRGLVNVPAAGYAVSDNEAPLNRPYHYEVVSGSGFRYQSNTITVQPVEPTMSNPASWPILSNPITGRSARVVIVKWDSLEVSNSGKKIEIPRRRTPVVLSDIEHSPTSAPKLLTTTAEAAAMVEQLLRAGEPVLLRAPAAGIPDAYLRVDSRSVERFSKSKANMPARLHNLEVTEVDPHDMTVRGSGDTLGDLNRVAPVDLGQIAATWSTLGQVAAADLLQFGESGQ